MSPWFVGLVSSFVVGQYNFVKQDVYTRDTVLVEVHALMYYSINDVRKVTAGALVLSMALVVAGMLVETTPFV